MASEALEQQKEGPWCSGDQVLAPDSKSRPDKNVAVDMENLGREQPYGLSPKCSDAQKSKESRIKAKQVGVFLRAAATKTF